MTRAFPMSPLATVQGEAAAAFLPRCDELLLCGFTSPQCRHHLVGVAEERRGAAGVNEDDRLLRR